MRKKIETQFEITSQGEPLVPWMFRQKSNGASLRSIASTLTQMTGISVSHESVRKWMRDG